MATVDTTLPSNTDGLQHLVVELVLLRVPSPASLVRAAAVCKLWRRVVADAGFLRLHRSLHTPAAAVAGYFFNKSIFPPLGRIASIHALFVPSSSFATDIDARHFSLDFLQDFHLDKGWKVLDSRGSLLLMKDASRSSPADFPDILVVCEPLARRYTRIPPPPDLHLGSCQLHGFYLVDGNAGGCISMSNFRVQCEVQRGGVMHAAVFTAGGGACSSWSEKAIKGITAGLHHTRHFGRAGGAWYSLSGDRTLVALDGHTGEYSSFDLPATEEWPAHRWNEKVYITDGRDGKPRIFSAAGNTMKVFARLGDGGGEWALEKKAVLLQEATSGLPGHKASFFDRPLLIWSWGPGFVTLIAWAKERWLFSVDLETMEVKPATADVQDIMYPCELPWPPVLHACLG
ncbi:unnamed protein product [Urochloa humidicola]